MNREEISAGGVLINNLNQVYLIHKISRDEWLLPKGKVDLGENLTQAALREIYEETGASNLKLLKEEPIFVSHYDYTGDGGEKVDKIVYYFLVETLSEKLVKTKEMEEEGLEGDWFELGQALDKVTYQDSREAIIKFQEIFLQESLL